MLIEWDLANHWIPQIMTWYSIALETDKAVYQRLEAIHDAFEKVARTHGGDPDLSVFELVEDDP